MPLIKHLTDQGKWIQNWYADDSPCTAKFSNLKVWFQKLCELGPDYGYHPEPKKMVWVVRATEEAEAKALFGELGVKIVRGHRLLGGFIGEEEDVHAFVLEKVKTWTSGVGALAEAAELYPQAAFAALSKSLQFQWSYMQRVVPNCESCFEILRNALNDIFWPALFQETVSDSEKKLFSLPARHGGLGIRDPLSTAVSSFANSRNCTAHIVDAIKCNSFFSVFNHIDHLSKLHRELNHDIEIQYQNLLNSVLQTFDNNKKRAIQRGIDGKTLAWLTVIPMAYHHFDLSATEFRDSLALRYHRPLLRLPALCDGCGSQFSTGHGLDCRKGGLVIQRHNEIRDALGDLASIAYKEVVREPVVREPNDREMVPALVADLSVCGVWQPQATTFFDVRVVDSDANSYLHHDVGAFLLAS